MRLPTTATNNPPPRSSRHTAQPRAHRLTLRGKKTLCSIDELLDRADRRAPVSARSRLLCAGLGVLAEDAYTALGGDARHDEVGHAAALLSLLTKVDDEVIDARCFHRGPLRTRDHTELRQATRNYLAPTLRSLRAAYAVANEPRCELAAQVGQMLRGLAASPARLDALLEVVAIGWEVQVDAVDVLSRHPDESASFEVARVTAAISGYWLLMITMIGALPAETERMLSPAERQAFIRWGWYIQRADALADFGKDAEAGLANSWAGYVLFERARDNYTEALRAGDTSRLYRLLRDTEADLTCVPACEAPLLRAASDLESLGQVPDWLRWIHGMLTHRYVTHAEVGGRVPNRLTALAIDPREG